MSRFINLDLEADGLMPVPPVQIISEVGHTTCELEDQEVSRALKLYSSVEKNHINASNGRSIMQRCDGLKRKLHHYARYSSNYGSSPVSLVERAMKLEQESQIRDITHRIVLQRKYHRPLRKRVNFVQEIVETQLFRQRHIQHQERQVEERRNRQVLRMINRSVARRVRTEGNTGSCL